jgi:hypothetical protein
MELTAWKGGGLAGTQYSVRLGPLDPDSLLRPEAGAVNQVVQDGFFSLPQRLPPRPGPPIVDALGYRMRIADDGRRHDVDWDDNSAAPPSLTTLMSLLADEDGWREVDWGEWH